MVHFLAIINHSFLSWAVVIRWCTCLWFPVVLLSLSLFENITWCTIKVLYQPFQTKDFLNSIQLFYPPWFFFSHRLRRQENWWVFSMIKILVCCGFTQLLRHETIPITSGWNNKKNSCCRKCCSSKGLHYLVSTLTRHFVDLIG